MKSFYENTMELEQMRGLSTPSAADLEKVVGMIKGDEELTRYFYDKLNPGWLELLEGAGEFEGLERKEGRIVERIKALYLVDCAVEKAEAVLGIVKKVKAKDAWIQGKMLDALVAMPEDVAIKGISIEMRYLREREYKVWYFVGEPAAKLMVKLTDKYPKEAFEIVKALLDLWRPGEKEAGVFETIRSKFATHEYKELMFEFYGKVWEKRPFEAMRVLVEIYDAYLDVCHKEKGYDISEYLGVSVEDLEDIGRLDYDIDAIVMKAICEAGRAVIEKEPEKISELLDDLEKRNKGIFHRTEMYLLRFAPVETEKDRINKLIGNQKFIENPLYKYEHRRLLNDKFDEVSDETRKAFVGWVKKEKITEDRRKEIKDWCEKNQEAIPDFEKMEYRAKAEKLYLVRERFKELYEEYKAEGGVKDDTALAPRRMVGEARWASPTEGTPLSAEEMAKKKVDEVLDYISEPKNYERKKKPSEWHDPTGALRVTFQEDVKKRAMEYVGCGTEKLAGLPAEFLSCFFYGVADAVRDGSFKKDGWRPLIDLAFKVVETKHEQKGYRNCFSAVLHVLRDGFGEGENKIDFDEEIVKDFWGILNRFIRFPLEDMENSGDEGDPMQLMLNQVPGQAMELAVSLGIVCRNRLGSYWENMLRAEIRQCWEYVVSNIKEPGVNCVFGVNFARMYWLDSEWVEQNLDKILGEGLWDEVWGTYVSWGRPSPQCFRFLVQGGIYGRAVGFIGKPNKYKFSKEPEKGLVEHLMIGFFNGWIGFEDKVLKCFFEKAPVELRGKAAGFLTTGFKSVNEKDGTEKEEIAERMREYWKKRLAAIADKPKENEEEAIELTGWVEYSVLPAKETLELLGRSLDLSGGKIGKMRGARGFVEGVYNLRKENELLALRCLKKAAVDENMHTPWSGIQKPLVSFLMDLPEGVRSEGREVADLYGRYNPDKFREVWEKLSVTRRREG